MNSPIEIENKKLRKKLRRVKLGLASTLSLVGLLFLWHCGPSINVPGAATATPLATAICSGNTILGVAGSALCAVSGTSTVVTVNSLLQSNALRNVTSTQITQAAEVGTAASSSLPSGYRDVPISIIDDEGGFKIGYCASSTATTQAACVALGGTFSWTSSICIETGGAYQTSTACTGGSRSWVSNGSGCTNLTQGADSNSCSTSYPISAATHAAFSNCGGPTYANLAASIANCASVNGAQATWNGALLGGHGEASWVLVARLAANKEVWQDQRTGLLWSSKATANDTWCKASGNAETPANGGTNCTGNTVSYCAEISGMTPGFAGDAGGVWQNTGRTYDNAKGGMGLQSAIPVHWRLATKYDHMQAELDGIRFVMPDMGSLSGNFEWSSTLYGGDRSQASGYYNYNGIIGPSARSSSFTIRCVGR